MDLIHFLGRFHVMVLHLPIALVLAAVAAEWLARRERYRDLQSALSLLWAAAAVTAIATVVLGYMHFDEGGFTGPSARMHRLLGTTLAIATTGNFLWRSRGGELYRKCQSAIAATLVLLVVLTGHYGGNLTHGDTFLVEYAPEPIRRLAGLEPARDPVTDIALADPYLDIVRPIFSQRCFSCHNDDKRRGGLNLARLDSTMKGGTDGVVLVAGKPDASDLYRRISLPHDDPDFMPAEGKTPLTAEQVATVRWWIEAGLPTKTSVAELKLAGATRALLNAQLGLAASGNAAAAIVPEADTAAIAPVDAAIIARLAASGFMARQSSQVEPTLMVGVASAGARLNAGQVATLAVAQDNLVELALQRTGIDDAVLSDVGRLTALKRLRLENNRITDQGVASLGALSKLQYLNLHGNAGITDRSIETLASLGALQRVYLWRTGISPAGAERLRRLRPELGVIMGDAAND
jgi:uncharacterized membrane protein/mono/diheme cytochrome c family protein